MGQARVALMFNNGITQQIPAGDFLSEAAGGTGQVSVAAMIAANDILLATNPIMKGLKGFTWPSGATADRPSPIVGNQGRWNSTRGCFEGNVGSDWVQMDNVFLKSYGGNVGVTSNTTLIPFDTSTPAVGEGTQLWSQSVTPSMIGSRCNIEFSGMVDSGTSNRGVTITIFRDSTLILHRTIWINTTNEPMDFSLKVSDPNTSLTAKTYSCRIGISSSATWYLGRASTATMGGVNNSGWSIDEVR